jgi:hypothetical protein
LGCCGGEGEILAASRSVAHVRFSLSENFTVSISLAFCCIFVLSILLLRNILLLEFVNTVHICGSDCLFLRRKVRFVIDAEHWRICLLQFRFFFFLSFVLRIFPFIFDLLVHLLHLQRSVSIPSLCVVTAVAFVWFLLCEQQKSG